jgi:hypothetical protein
VGLRKHSKRTHSLENTMTRTFVLSTVPLALAAAIAMSASSIRASGASSSIDPIVFDDATLEAMTATLEGADVVSTTRTIPHWWGSTLDPSDGVTYGYNIVGANPFTCTGSDCSVTIEADITPVLVRVGGRIFDGNDVLDATLASPQFQANDYGSTPFATAGVANRLRGAGGLLSQDDSGNGLQLQDATMRAQFNRTGASAYHLILHPNVQPAVTIDVPVGHAGLLRSDRGVVVAAVDVTWWSAQIQNLTTKGEPTHLAIYLTDNVLLSLVRHGGFHCCVIGFHGTRAVGHGDGSANSNGNAKVQTFAWASYLSPGVYASASGGALWALQDIHVLSHEIAEWANDPFVTNIIEPWYTPTAPQYGCSVVLETGDPVVGVGFVMGGNVFRQGPNPNGTQSADGYYHPEDEVFLPWFMRSAPNTVSEPTQSPSSNIGRYTLMGDLNMFPGFHRPATGCS